MLKNTFFTVFIFFVLDCGLFSLKILICKMELLIVVPGIFMIQVVRPIVTIEMMKI